MGRRKDPQDDALTMVLTIIFVGLLLPVFGWILIDKRHGFLRFLGWCMLIFGILIWLFLIIEVF